MKNGHPMMILRAVAHSRFALGLLALGLMTFAATGVAQAQNNFNVRLGESPRLLEATLHNTQGSLSDMDLMDIIMEESCVNPVARYQNRNRFSVLVENTSTTGNLLTSFTLDLVELGYEFGDGDFAADGFNGSLAMDMGRSDAGVSLSGSYGSDASELVVNFSGLSAGKAAIFRVDLDPSASNTSGMLYPDYREAVLGANGNELALVDVAFSSGKQFADLPFMTDIHGDVIDTRVLEAYHSQAPSGRDPDSGVPTFLSGDVVPEPTSAILFLLGVAGMLSVRKRR